MSTQPTDAELDAVIGEYQTRIYPQDMHPRFERAIMRAAITKWGQPAPGEQNESAYQRGYMDGMAKVRRDVGAASQQEAREPCPTCVALARTVMLDQVSFDRKPDCYGIRQITDDECVEEWEDIRTSPDVAREEANDMMATGRGEIYEVVPLYTAPQPAPVAQGDALSDAVRVPLDSLHADAAYLIGRLREGSMPYARVIEIIRERIDAAKAAIRASAAHGQAPAGATKPTEQQILEAAEKAGLWPNTVHSWIPAFHRYHKELAKAQPAQAQPDSELEDAERWEFRWLNPANNLHVAPSDLGWKTVNSKGMRSEKEVLEDLQAYRYQGKPVYEVRRLLATRALEKPEIRCPVRLANGGDCPRHNLQCGWPDCNKESK